VEKWAVGLSQRSNVRFGFKRFSATGTRFDKRWAQTYKRHSGLAAPRKPPTIIFPGALVSHQSGEVLLVQRQQSERQSFPYPADRPFTLEQIQTYFKRCSRSRLWNRPKFNRIQGRRRWFSSDFWQFGAAQWALQRDVLKIGAAYIRGPPRVALNLGGNRVPTPPVYFCRSIASEPEQFKATLPRKQTKLNKKRPRPTNSIR